MYLHFRDLVDVSTFLSPFHFASCFQHARTKMFARIVSTYDSNKVCQKVLERMFCAEQPAMRLLIAPCMK